MTSKDCFFAAVTQLGFVAIIVAFFAVIMSSSGTPPAEATSLYIFLQDASVSEVHNLIDSLNLQANNHVDTYVKSIYSMCQKAVPWICQGYEYDIISSEGDSTAMFCIAVVQICDQYGKVQF